MRILLVSPHFKPMPGGVSDYSFQFACELEKLGHEVTVVTRASGEDKANREATFRVVTVSDFSLRTTSLLKELCRDHRIERILFQWTPLAFAPKSLGILPSLFLTLLFLRPLPVNFMVHESHYPVLMNLRGLLIGLPHFIQFMLFSLVTKKLFFSHEAAKRYWQRFLFFKREGSLETLPVFSNIPVSKSLSEKEEGPEAKATHCLVYFGGQHPTNNLHFVRAAFDRCRKELGDKVSLKLIGITKENCPDILKGEGINPLGYLPETQVSEVLAGASLMLAPFTDGVSTRRGSVMAGLSHQRAILTTDGVCTLEDIPWSDIVCVVSGQDKVAYEDQALTLLKNSHQREELANKGHAYYDLHFSASQVASRYIEAL